ncbi:putative polygalacturonase [Microthyrium microscopicum]|uniref:galacturonan 1,4-alpha-galacturonidase n=1 Tax=Microthyrium microscopicum TaxID=703497 RepID=A0A6A6U1N9_9PEZI|nr:putative polygalacturonase [Microthyrium microscopicum]
MPVSTPRTKTCEVAPGADDASAILSAVKSCNNGGRVVLARGAKYTISKPMDLRDLQHIDIVLQGTLTFSSDTSYWQKNAFKFKFQNAACYFQLGGTDVNVYGGGTIDGNGGVWGAVFAANKDAVRPIPVCVVEMNGGSISDIKMRNSAQWFNLVVDSKNVVYSGISIDGHAKNTDGWDTLRSDNIVIQNSNINNGDDCVSFKPGSTNIVVQNLNCKGSHGISVGSLGQYRGQVDIVEDIYVGNVTMSNASSGARIKVWPNVQSTMGELSGGGGTGRVRNIVFEKMHVTNVEWAVLITQCYAQKDLNKCRSNPTSLAISNVVIKDFTGTTSGKHGSQVGSLICGSPSVCTNISVSNINVKAPGGGSSFECKNIPTAGLKIPCSK